MPPALRAYARSLFALLAMLVLATPDAAAQARYKQDPIDAKLRPKGSLAKNYVRSGSGDPAAKQQFEDFIEKYYLPSMTQWARADAKQKDPLEDLGNKRVRFFKDYVSVARGATQQYLTQQAYQFARRVFSSPNYHPSVRYNAILLLGQLDEKPATGDSLAVPLADANKLLAAVLERGVDDGRRPRYEMAGALVGLERHAALLPRQQLGPTVKALQKLLEADELPGYYASGVKDYLYVQAAQAMAKALATVGSPGRDGVYVNALGKRVADESLELETRAEIASQLAQMKLKPKQFDASSVALAVSDLAVAVAEQEKEYAVKFEDMMQFGAGGARRSQPSGRDKFESRIKSDNQNGEVELVLDGMISILRDANAAATAVESIADEQSAAAMKAIAQAISKAESVALDDNSVDLDVTLAVKTMADEVAAAALTPPEPAEEAPAEEAAVAEAAEAAPAADGAE